MATNTQQRDHNIPFIAPSGGVSSNEPILVGTSLFVSASDYAAGEEGIGYAVGVYDDIPADSDTAFTNMAPLYWNDTDTKLYNGPDVGTGTGAPFVGHAFGAKAEAATTCSIRLQISP